MMFHGREFNVQMSVTYNCQGSGMRLTAMTAMPLMTP